MKRIICFAIAGLFAMAAPSNAEPWLFGRNLISATCPPSCYNCPDDYSAKPLPHVCRVCTGCLPDDYCQKPLPYVPCPVRGCGDDYCSKPFPCCLPPSIRPWYGCGLTSGPCVVCTPK
jgi:hypothetical protein